MKTIIITSVSANMALDGSVEMIMTHKDGREEKVKLGKVPFVSQKEISNDLSPEEKEIVAAEAQYLCEQYFIANQIKTEAQIRKETDQFIADIESGVIPPNIVGYFW